MQVPAGLEPGKTSAAWPRWSRAGNVALPSPAQAAPSSRAGAASTQRRAQLRSVPPSPTGTVFSPFFPPPKHRHVLTLCSSAQWEQLEPLSVLARRAELPPRTWETPMKTSFLPKEKQGFTSPGRGCRQGCGQGCGAVPGGAGYGVGWCGCGREQACCRAGWRLSLPPVPRSTPGGWMHAAGTERHGKQRGRSSNPGAESSRRDGAASAMGTWWEGSSGGTALLSREPLRRGAGELGTACCLPARGPAT